jgi:NAD(P) transhydrogenase subunit alpha
MSMQIAIPKETLADEKRVALIPSLASKIHAIPAQINFETGAGVGADYPDAAYADVALCKNAAEVYKNANIILKVRAPEVKEVKLMPEGAILVGLLAPHQNDAMVKALCEKKITSFALERLPRTTRAQAMDVLSSQASIAGYKAVLIAANLIGQFFPMLTTAAGTIRPVKALVIGAGVAGLQAIATARRLGAIVHAYDIRPEAREQVESLGAKMIDTGVDARGEGGYARELTDAEKQQQADKLAEHFSKVDVVITTAAIPGRPAPKIISQAMVERMPTGSVIVDIAAESGGNCALTQAGNTIQHQGVTISGPCNLGSSMARDASDMYARNVFNFLQLLLTDGKIHLNWEDDILAASVLTHDGERKH